MRRNSWVLFTITTALLVATITISAIAESRIADPLVVPLDRIDSRILGWTEVGQPVLDAETLKVLNPTTYLARSYEKHGSQLDLFIAYYAQQKAGESMHSPQHCLPGSGWEIMSRESVAVPAGGHRAVVNEDHIENLGTKMLMIYWYQSRTRIVASEYEAKLLLARDTLLTGHTAGSIVRILVPDSSAKAQQGIAFASALIPEVQRCLGTNNNLAVSDFRN